MRGSGDGALANELPGRANAGYRADVRASLPLRAAWVRAARILLQSPYQMASGQVKELLRAAETKQRSAIEAHHKGKGMGPGRMG